MNGELVKQFNRPTKRYVQILDIAQDAELIRKYCYCHSQEAVWPEIIEQQREVGILEMEIYRHENHLVMIVEAEADFDWETGMNRLAAIPRQAEWEAHVAAFQGCSPDARSDEKWQPCERIFYHYGQ
ncbi:MAG: L-rhamnose mutarotase [Bacteroidales bacterium]|nr:L-rhamnose mutarotase [Bacteroidales bacterium]